MATQGPLYPSNAFTGAASPESANDWLTPGNIGAADGAEAEITHATYDAGDVSFRLLANNFGFTIPAGATIDGITVEVYRRCFAGAARDYRIQLIDDTTTLVGSNKAVATAWPASLGLAIYGGTTDAWGAGLTAAQINSAGFGVCLSVEATAANTDVGIDYVRITVTYTASANESKSGSDAAGTPVESAGRTATIASAQVAGTPVETASLAATRDATDVAGAPVEGATVVPTEAKTGSDVAGTPVEQSAISAPFASSDAGSPSTDVATLASAIQAPTDTTGGPVETASLAATRDAADAAGSVTEAGGFTAAIESSQTATATDAADVQQITPKAGSDVAGAIVEGASVTVVDLRVGSDAAAATDAATLGATAAGSDATAPLVEGATVDQIVTVAGTDAGVTVELVTDRELVDVDGATATDSAAVFGGEPTAPAVATITLVGGPTTPGFADPATASITVIDGIIGDVGVFGVPQPRSAIATLGPNEPPDD